MTMPFEPRLLAGPPPTDGPQRLEAHRTRVGAFVATSIFYVVSGRKAAE
jgi:hypothetical protein